MLFFLSLFLSICTVIVLYFVVDQLVVPYFPELRPLFLTLYQKVGLAAIFSITGIVCFVIYVVWLSWNTVAYMGQITKAVQQLSRGSFDVAIPVRTMDEIGDLAENINRMSRQLKSSITEERIAVQTKNELITNVSHDLRTPLTSIIGYLRLIEEDRYKDEVELRHYVNVAYEKSRRLGRMVEDLFEFTRVSLGDVKLVQMDINLVELLGQLSVEYSVQLQDVQMDIETIFSEDKIMVRGDGDKLMRVFENLLSNAIKYGKYGKRIDVTVRKELREAVVRIVNYGTPIPAMDLPYIFDRLYRVDKSRSDETGGTGLGLAIAKSIIELHKGSISVASDVHETAFEVRLPLV